jgi:hypothetical protein
MLGIKSPKVPELGTWPCAPTEIKVNGVGNIVHSFAIVLTPLCPIRNRPIGRVVDVGNGRVVMPEAKKERRDTFFVRPRTDEEPAKTEKGRKPASESLKFPDGRKVHALERGLFDEALRAAINR